MNMIQYLCIIILLQLTRITFVTTETLYGSYQLIGLTKDPKSYYGKLCNSCRKFYQSILSLFVDHIKLENMQMKLVNFCEYVGPLRDQCVSLFTFTMFKIINKSMANIDPLQSCESWYLCYRK